MEFDSRMKLEPMHIDKSIIARKDNSTTKNTPLDVAFKFKIYYIQNKKLWQPNVGYALERKILLNFILGFKSLKYDIELRMFFISDWK